MANPSMKSGQTKTDDSKNVGRVVRRFQSHAAVKQLSGDSRVSHPGQPISLGGNMKGKVAPSVGQDKTNC